MGDAREDSRLVAASLAGDDGAFAALIERHRARAGAVALAMLGDAGEAEDTVQEALLRAYTDLRRLREPASFGAWLAAIAVNLARMRLRRRVTTLPLDELADGLPTPDGRLEAVELLRLVRAALDALTPAQRQVVLLRYADGLSPSEIAARLGRSAGAVRVQLHRARGRLRVELADMAPRRKETPLMTEVELYDVLVRVIPGAEGPPRLASARLRVVLLKEQDGQRLLPIWVGAPEGDALVLHRGGEAPPRPLTSDLMVRLLGATDGRIERVAITSLREKTFYALVRVASHGRTEELDARPSDAVNLAVRVGAPIFVEDEVLAQAAIPLGEFPERLDDEDLCPPDETDEPAEWRSLSPELVLAAWTPPGKTER